MLLPYHPVPILLRECTHSAYDFDVPAYWVSWPKESDKGKDTQLVVPCYDCRPYETQDGMSLNLKIVYTKVHPQQYVVGPVLAS